MKCTEPHIVRRRRAGSVEGKKLDDLVPVKKPLLQLEFDIFEAIGKIPDLTGTEKQIAYAEVLRDEKMHRYLVKANELWLKATKQHHFDSLAWYVFRIELEIKTNKASRYWIENKHNDIQYSTDLVIKTCEACGKLFVADMSKWHDAHKLYCDKWCRTSKRILPDHW